MAKSRFSIFVKKQTKKILYNINLKEGQKRIPRKKWKAIQRDCKKPIVCKYGSVSREALKKFHELAIADIDFKPKQPYERFDFTGKSILFSSNKTIN